MKRYLKLVIVIGSVVVALCFTIYQNRSSGTLSLSTKLSQGASPTKHTSKNYDLSGLKVFNVALVRVKDNYVKPQMVQPKQMLVAALDGVEKTVAEVLVEEKEQGKTIDVNVDSFHRTFDISTVDSPWALSSKMKRILSFIQAHLLKSTDARDVEYAAINGMLSTLDPHSILLTPDTYNEMKLSTRGEFGGLGIVISMVKGVLTVMNPMKGTPAEQAGLKACDSILKIGEESTVNMTLNQAVNRLRGAPDSKVDITITRGGWTRPVKKTLTRAQIKVPAVKSRMLAKRIGYLSLSSFQGNSIDEIEDHLGKLKQKGMKGLIIDLRGNPGGLLDQAIKIADLFLDSGTIVTTVSFAGKRREEKRAQAEGTEGHYPIAVLVDSGSASASEIVAGALKNLDRAVIIGNRTFGKGSVQVLYDNDDGSALKLTIAEYLTPGDVSIQAVGIAPDVETSPVFIRDDFVHLKRAFRTRREQDLSKHLVRKGNELQKVKPLKSLYYVVDKDKEEEEEEGKQPRDNLCLYPDRECKPTDEDKFVEDFQVKVARDMLAKAQGWHRSRILAGATKIFEEKEAEQEKNIVAALHKLGVDWTTGPAPEKKPKLALTVASLPKQGQGDACHEMKLKATVKNEGEGVAYRVKVLTKSSNDVFDGHEFVFGKLNPGQSRTWSVPVKVRDIPTRVDDVTFTLSEANGSVPPPVTRPFKIKGMDRPIFAYGYQLIDDIVGNKDGRPQRGEQVRLFVKVRNIGKGTAFRTITTLKNESDAGIFIRKGRHILDRLAPGETKFASFTFDIQPSFQEKGFKVELAVYDDALRESVTNTLEFDIADTADGPKPKTGAVTVTAANATFRAWAAPSAPVVGTAPKGAVFSLIGEQAGWQHVDLGSTRSAFVLEKEVALKGRPAGPSKFVAHWQVTPPTITVKLPAYATTEKTMHISGTAVDERRVKDLFIFVRNPDAKISARKVYYRSNTANTKSTDRLDFATDIPLWPGANYVTINARENVDVQGQETLVIFRKKDVAMANTAASGGAAKNAPATK